MSGQRIAAVDIGGTSVKACIFNNGFPINMQEVPTLATEGAKQVIQRTTALLESFLPFDAIGVSTTGQVNFATGSIRYANQNMPGYTGVRIKEVLEETFGVPVIIENDVNAAALGEGACGAAQGFLDYLCLTYGTGVGGAIVMGGALLHGAYSSAGEFGAIAVHPEAAVSGDPYSGCYERYASATALVESARAVNPVLINGRILFSHISEPYVQQLVNRWLDEVAIGLCTLLHIFNPSCIVLGGGIMEQPYIINGVQASVRKRAIPSFLPCRIVAAQLGNMAGLHGAFGLATSLVCNIENKN